MRYLKKYIIGPFKTVLFKLFVNKNKKDEKPNSDDIYPLW